MKFSFVTSLYLNNPSLSLSLIIRSYNFSPFCFITGSLSSTVASYIKNDYSNIILTGSITSSARVFLLLCHACQACFSG